MANLKIYKNNLLNKTLKKNWKINKMKILEHKLKLKINFLKILKKKKTENLLKLTSKNLYKYFFYLNQFNVISKSLNYQIKKLIFLKKKNISLRKKNHLERESIFFSNFNKHFILNNYWKTPKSKKLVFLKKKTNFFDFSMKKKNNHFLVGTNTRKKWFLFFKLNQQLLANFLFLKKKINQRLKKYFSIILKKSLKTFFLNIEFSLVNILIKTRFCLTKNQVINFCYYNYIYKNGFLIHNFQEKINFNDIIQLVFTSYLFKFFFYIKQFFKKFMFRIKYCLNRWYKHKFNFYKQKPKKLPSWILKLTFNTIKITKYYEIEYRNLTIILLNQINIEKIILTYANSYLNFFLLRQYNWRLSN